eukprot:TRINITY_DN7581_c0_g1_i1.p1 TRINITY_DN7581_c0_g1~~TRINITY_DN7581_c0_g1_i1.p1  ORF type:complete len:266 (-),score=58.93 TRINITY_DN7581_c0_g1_i1:95-856(-)
MDTNSHNRFHDCVSAVRAKYNKYSEIVNDCENAMKMISISDLESDQLVLDFLYRHGFVEIAETMAEECQMETIDADYLNYQSQFRNHFENRDILSARSCLNELDPSILDEDYQLHFRIQLQHMIELLKDSKVTEALLFVQTELAELVCAHDHLGPWITELFDKTMALFAYEDFNDLPDDLKILISNDYLQKLLDDVNVKILKKFKKFPMTALEAICKQIEYCEEWLSTNSISMPLLNTIIPLPRKMSPDSMQV